MSQYRLPEPGSLDPIGNLHHYTGNYLVLLKEGGLVSWEAARKVLSGVIGGFADGTYTYQHSQAFNPEVAGKLREEVLSVLRKSASGDEIKNLEDKLLSIADEHAIQTGQPERTRAALDDLIAKLKAERQSQP